MSNYKPMTADEAAKLSLRSEGVYAFEVTDAKAAVSKEKQNPMIALQLRFFDNDGDGSFSVKDWLVHSDSRWAEKKFFDFANSTGLQAKYAEGTMTAEDCLGRTGYAMVGIEAGKPKNDGSGNFPDKNKVKYYTSKPTAAKSAAVAPAVQAKAAAVPSVDDSSDIPF